MTYRLFIFKANRVLRTGAYHDPKNDVVEYLSKYFGVTCKEVQDIAVKLVCHNDPIPFTVRGDMYWIIPELPEYTNKVKYRAYFPTVKNLEMTRYLEFVDALERTLSKYGYGTGPYEPLEHPNWTQICIYEFGDVDNRLGVCLHDTDSDIPILNSVVTSTSLLGIMYSDVS